MPHASAHKYDHDHTLRSQEPAGVSQHQPLVSGITTPYVAAYYEHDDRNPILHEPARASVSQLQPSIVAPDNSHLQVPPGGGYANLQSQLQVSTSNAFNQQPPTTNQPEYHNVSHGPTHASTIHYPTPRDPSMSQTGYGRYNSLSATHQLEVSDIRPAHDASAYSDHQLPCSQNPVGGSYNSLAQSEPPSTFQQAYNQYPQDGSSNLNMTQSASQEPAFPPTSLYLTPSNPSTSQVASGYGYRDSQPAAPASSDQPPYYLQDPVGRSHNSLAQSEPPSSVFQQTYSRYLQGGSFNVSLAQSTPQGQAFPPTSVYPTPSNPSTSQVTSGYGYRDSQPAAGTSYDQPPYLQNPAGRSYSHPIHSEPLSFTLSTSQQSVNEVLHDGSSNVAQNAPKVPTLFPIVLDPSTSQAAPTQSSWPALNARSSDDQEQPLSFESQGGITRMAKSRQIHRKLERSKRILSTSSPMYLSSASMPLVRSTSPLPIDDSLIKRVKAEASRLMNVSLIRETLFPTKNRNTELADAALTGAIVGCSDNDNVVATTLAAWKSRTEGHGTLIRLKGTVKQIHKDCQDKSCARGAVAGAFELCVQILFKNTEDIVPSRKLGASALLSGDDCLDTIIQRANGGQSQTFRVPFGHSAVFIMTEHILVDLGYRRYILLDSPSDWEPALRNIVALSATVCELEIQQCSKTGWFKPIDLEAEGKTVYVKMTERMASLQGTDLREFRWMLSFWRLLLKTLPVC
ncbi:hypothetical protein EDD22DRAFT_949062 [Suillus occidentalis]|nr:hypothetical protein EDD22DRAFT_949062 [Suillus occidentalis]